MTRDSGERVGHSPRSEESESKILTPDRRVRVFISSTLGELADERRAAKAAIESLHLTPVMFEAGARPHPPRDLYRAYLTQSDVFVGIYGESYGWVAPDMDRSGLEDEYRLSGECPRLIYVKDSHDRDSRLVELIAEIAEDGISYRRFRDSDELRRLLVDDLAILLSEHFYRDGKGSALPGDGAPGFRRPPIPANPFIGREAEIEEVIGLLSDPETRLVTISGPGGVGKSRLALEVAARVSDQYEGITLTLLEEVHDSEEVVPAMLADLGISESAIAPLDAIGISLEGRPWLFVIDNFEHVITAATQIGDLLELVPSCQILTTSRVALGIRAEHLFNLEPLAIPEEGMDRREVLSTPSVELFLSRAEATGSKFDLERDAGSLLELARLLEGMPLAIELAAGRARILSPDQIMGRLKQSFGLLESDSADLPQRHRSMEATIKWSFELLTEDEAKLAGALSVFEGGFTVESAEGVCGRDVLDGLSSLLAKNLVRFEVGSGHPRLMMLRPIRDYAFRALQQTGDETKLRAAHTVYFLQLAESAAPGLRGPSQIEWMDRLSREHMNVTAAIAHSVSLFGADVAASSLWNIYPYLEYMGECREALSLGNVILAHDPDETHRGRTLSILGLMSFWLGDIDSARRESEQAVDVLANSSDEVGLAYARGLCGVLGLMGPDPARARAMVAAAAETLDASGDQFGSASLLTGVSWMIVWLGLGSDADVAQQAVDAARTCGATTELAVSLCNKGLQLMREGRPDEARALLIEGLETARATESVGLETLTLASIVEVVADSAQPMMAVTLAGAIQSARTRESAGDPAMRWTGIPLPSLVVAHLGETLSRLRTASGPDAYERAWDQGEDLSLIEAAEQTFEMLHRQPMIEDSGTIG